MLFSSWLRNWKRSLERRSALSHIRRLRPPACRFAPRLFLEALEDRTVLSPVLSLNSTVAVAVVNGSSDVVTSGGQLIALNGGGGNSAGTVTNGTQLTDGGTWTDTTLGATVTLTSSQPGLLQNADGTWTWSGTTPTGPGPVSITATDNLGSRTSIQFWLNVGQVLKVNTGVDDGDNSNPTSGSLRAAIIAANQAPSAGGPTLIAFNIPTTDPCYDPSTGSFDVLTPAQGLNTIPNLPGLITSVMIDGYTQQGSSPNTMPVLGSNAGDNAVRNIILDGSNVGSQADGLTIAGGNSTVQGLKIQNFNQGFFANADIHLTTNGNDLIAGNYLAGGFSVWFENVPNNTIGGTSPGTQNYMRPTIAWIQGVEATDNEFQGNFAGQVMIEDASNNVVGGSQPGAGNVLSGASKAIYILGESSSTPANDNLVQGNYIGTDRSGTGLPADGALGTGVIVAGYANNNIIGGPDTNAPGAPLSGGGNLISGCLGDAIYLGNVNVHGTVVAGNYIGTNADGSAALVPLGTQTGGIESARSINPVISGNLISGCKVGLVIGASIGASIGAQVQDNKIGTDATGTKAIPNFIGVVDSSNGDLLGGTTPGSGNIIAFNDGFATPLFNSLLSNGPAAVEVFGTGDQIEGNYIYSNNSPAAVEVFGTGDQVEGNSIYSNAGAGVWVQSDPFGSNDPFGAFSDGFGLPFSFGAFSEDLSSGISIQGNSIYANGGLGIALGTNAVDVKGNPLTLQQVQANLQSNPNLWDNDEPSNTVILNDSLGHVGANNFQNFPVLSSASSSSTSTVVTGTFSEVAEPDTTLTLDFYANATPDTNKDPNGVSGYGQGQTYLGSRTVYTDGSGNVSFTADLAVGNLASQWISATATDPNGNTSEFSLDIQASSAPSQTFTQNLPSSLPQSSVGPNTMTIQADPTTINDVVSGLSTNNLGASVVPVSVYLNLAPGTYQSQTIQIPQQGMTLYINGQQGTTIDPVSPALTIVSGTVIVSSVTLISTGDAPTILVRGGNLTLLNDDVIQASTTFTDPAIAVSGGAVNLGTSTAPGNNTLSVNSSGDLVSNTTGNAISAVGDTFVVGGTVETAPNLSFTAVTSSAATSILNQAVTLTATVQANGSSVTPTGSVDFFDTTTNTDLGSVSLSGGVATLPPAILTPGTHVIVAKYSGDANFLPSANTFTQSVQYKFSGFLPPLSNSLTFAVNRTIPIQFQLSDYNGKAITSLSAVTSLQIQALDANGNPVGAPITPVSTNNQGWQYSGGQYLFNWQTKNLKAGSYQIMLKLADGTTHTKTIQLTAGGSSAGLVSDGSGGTATAGALLGGEVDLYVDNGNGDLTSDELARVQDAVNAVDARIAPYGVVINEVSDPTQANVTLNMNTTSSLGGVAQGVLGCTTDADQVTMIQGWNWYAGADPTQVGSGQYDFETAVMHELGHVLGLGHSGNSTSVMYATLAAGTTNRTLVSADLNVPDDDSGPCALHAAPATAMSSTTNGTALTPPSSASIPASGSPSNGSPMSAADQLFANLSRILSAAQNAYQSELSSVVAMWRSGGVAMQRLDVLLSMEAGVMGVTKDTLMRDFFFASNFSTNGV
jgi:hypothetical protein